MKTFYCFLLIVIVFASCEYEPGGINYNREVSPPDEAIEVNITLNDFQPEDTIYIFNSSANFNVRFNAGGNEILQFKYAIDNREPEMLHFLQPSPTNQFSFTVHDFGESNKHTLTLDAVFKSGTGSLADMLGMEGYQGKMKWNIKLISNTNQFKIGYRKSNDGFLEIYWDHQAAFPESIVEKYLVEKIWTTVTLPVSQKSLIDYDYVYGSSQYKVEAVFKNSNTGSFSKHFYVNTPEPVLHFENQGVDKLRVYWDEPFANARFELKKWGDETAIFSDISETSVIIPQMPFGKILTLVLSVAAERNPNVKTYISGLYLFGEYLSLGNFPEFVYNKPQNLIYSTSYSDVIAFNANTMKEVSRKRFSNMTDRLSCSPTSSKVAVSVWDEIHIYPDKSLVNPVVIPLHPQILRLTDSYLFVISFTTDRKCHVFDIQTGLELYSFPLTYFPSGYEFGRCISVSNDGKYFCCCSANGIEIFEITATKATQVYSDNRYYYAAIFHPLQTGVLVTKVQNDLEVLTVPGFVKTKTTNIGSSVLYDIDPVTGYILYRQQNKLQIATLDKPDQPLLTIPYTDSPYEDVKVRLLNQMLLSSDDAYLNTSQYLNP